MTINLLLRKIHRRLNDVWRRPTHIQRSNLLKYQQELQQARKHNNIAIKPVTISLVSTGRCNLACDMCVTHSKQIPDDYPWAQNPTKDINLATFKKMVRTFPEAMQVQIIGQGEPVLNKEFFDIVEYGTKHRMRVKSFSNGTTLKAYMDKVLDSSLHTLSISVNSADAEDYQRLTGMAHGSHKTILENVKSLVKKRNQRISPLVIHATFILDKQNYQSVPAMLKLATSLGVDGILLCNFLPADHEGFRIHERTITTDDTEIVSFIDQAVPSSLRRWVCMPDILDLHQDRKDCHCHWSQVRSNGNGELSSCSVMLLNTANNPNINNMDNGQDAWNHEWFQSMRDKFISHDKADLDSPCNYCTENFGVQPWNMPDSEITEKVSN